ncbi:uncharacterized protein [Procambarus clarkii]|uniref:uncharacterized protein n=1 Tax=Procambarus clarkii TaxID=6728 RepID=UPI003743BF75
MPYQPTSNCLAERTNKKLTVNNALRVTVNRDSHKWNELMPIVQSSINSSVNSSIGNTPHSWLYRTDMRFPNALISSPPVSLYNYDDYGKVKQRDTQLVFLRVKEHLSKATNDFTRLQNAHAKPTKIVPGSSVMILNQRRDGPKYKLTEKFLGSYRVLEHITGNKYKLENLATGEHVNEDLSHMKLARLTVDQDSPVPVNDHVMTDPTTVTPTLVEDINNGTASPGTHTYNFRSRPVILTVHQQQSDDTCLCDVVFQSIQDNGCVISAPHFLTVSM